MTASRFALALLCLPIAAAAGSKTVDGDPADWTGISTLLGGTAQISDGELVYQDFIYDDYGADAGQRPPNYSTLSTNAAVGDYRYPNDEARYGHNAADLFQIRLAASADDVWVLVALNTFKEADSTVVAIAIDTDADLESGSGIWPNGAGITTPGADYVVTLVGNTGWVTDLATNTETALGEVAADTDANVIEARIPRSLVPGATWQLWAASGLWDGDLGEWMAVPPTASTDTSPGYGNPTIAARAFNVAFRDGDLGAYFEQGQAAALAAGDIGHYSLTVSLADLELGADIPYQIENGRLYEAIMKQTFTIPPQHEGTSFEGVPGRFAGLGGAALSQTFHFYGPWQPYSIYLPSAYDGVTELPIALALHGIGGSHASYNRFPGFIRDFAEDPPTVVVSTLARGASFYADWGEADTLEVMEDVRNRFVYDEDRYYLTGYSMGGFGVYRLGVLYPDRFAGAATWAGYTGQYTGTYLTSYEELTGDPLGLQENVYEPIAGEPEPNSRGKNSAGDPVDALENMLHLPILIQVASNDEIVPTTGQLAAPHKLRRLGYRHRADVYLGYEHLTFGLLDDWKEPRKWLLDKTRTTRVRRIVHRVSEAWVVPEARTVTGIDHGRVWWLRDLRMREHEDDVLYFATVDATSHRIPANEHSPRLTADLSLAPTPNVRLGTEWNLESAETIENRLTIDLANASEAVFDAAEAELTPEGLAIEVTTDGPSTVILEGDFSTVAVSASPAGVVVGADGNALTLEVPAAGTWLVEAN